LPGEKVIARYVSQRRKFDELQVEDSSLIEFSHPSRVVPPCAYALICGGCALQHINTAQQITHKQQVFSDQLQHFGHLQGVELVAPLTSTDLGYRTKARLGVRYVAKHDEVIVGFRERYSNFLTRIDQCSVLVPQVGTRITELKALVRSLSCYQRIPQIEVAAGSDRCALVFRHMEPLTDEDHGKLIAFYEETGLEIYLQPKGPDTVHKLWPEDRSELLSYIIPGVELTFDFHPNDFTQVNPAMNRKMLHQAIQWLDLTNSDRVLDLFCGLGNFTLPVARLAAAVTGVEGSTAMVERGYHNAHKNRISNVEFFGADLHLPMDANRHQPWVKPFDKVLLDPPRSGAEEIVKAIDLFRAPLIVYISCNPATLARDAGILTEKGYKLQKAGVMDMFPHTTHIESMALFRR
jgi:23S rRNA (uracil1939-C5)-methyltransferase